MSSIFERYARTAKASRLAVTIQRAHAGLDLTVSVADVAAALSPEQRRAVEATAGVRQASDATWNLVIELLTPARPVNEAALFDGIGP